MHAVHLVPFLESMAAGVACLMTSHPVYPNLDPAGVPATFSRLIVTDYLRGQLGFRGVVLSDDLEMGAVAERCPVGEAAVRAAAAGHDLLLVCHTEGAQRAAARALTDAYRAGALPRRELDTAVERVRRLRQERDTRFGGGPPAAEPDGAPLAMAMASRAVTVVAPGRPGLKRAFNGRVVVVFPRFSDLAARITIEPELTDEKGYLARAFAAVGIEPDALVVGMEPTPAEIEEAAGRAAGADATVLFLYDAHLYPSNRALLDALQARARALAVALLRDPYDASLLRPDVLGVTAYGFRRCQLDAVIARLGF
jgi:beta-N-acetylhexosaminidase